MWPVHMYNVTACVKCMKCTTVCPDKLLYEAKNGFRPVDSKHCNLCVESGTAPCERACSYEARNFSSKPMSVDEVWAECLKECGFWGDGGGITLSGGEPLLHVDFCNEIGKMCWREHINLAVETCGYVPWENIKKMAEIVDIFLYDIKLVTPALRREWLGAESKLDLDNLRRLTGIHNHVVLRIPLIPSVNDTEEEFGAILGIANSLPHISGMQILPFHQYGSGKYALAGMTYSLAEMQAQSEENAEHCRNMAAKAGFEVDIGGKAFTSRKE